LTSGGQCAREQVRVAAQRRHERGLEIRGIPRFGTQVGHDAAGQTGS